MAFALLKKAWLVLFICRISLVSCTSRLGAAKCNFQFSIQATTLEPQ